MGIYQNRLIRKARKSNLVQGNLFDAATINYFFYNYILEFHDKGITFVFFGKDNNKDIFTLNWNNIKDCYYQKKFIGCCYYFVFYNENTTRDVYVRFSWLSKKKELLHSKILNLLQNNTTIKIIGTKEKIKNYMI